MVLMGTENNSKKEIIIPTESIRFRVIANSNEEIDIASKQNLKDYMEDIVYDLIRNSTNKEEANKIIVDNFDYLNKKIYEYLRSWNIHLKDLD